MASGTIDIKTIFKLVIWSMIVGWLLFFFEVSPGDVYSLVADRIAGTWNWLSGSALQYILVGATIVVPIFLFSHFRAKARMRQNRPPATGRDSDSE